MPQTSDSVSRGRTQVLKPPTAVSASLTAPTASTRAKAKPRLSAPTTSADIQQSTDTEPSTPLSAVDATPNVPRQVGIEKRSGAPVQENSIKLKSQPLKVNLNKEPFEKHTSTTREATAFSEIATTSSDALEDSSAQPPVNDATIQDAPSVLACDESSQLGTQSNPPANVPPTVDPLQVAAQTYPWLYMNSTLDACFTKAEQSAKQRLDVLENQVSRDEADLADEKARYESERLIEFCDELNSGTFAKEAPAIMQSFMSFGEICERVEAEALQLAMTTPSFESEEPLQVYNTMMDSLDDLQEQASELESSILRLTESNVIASTSHPLVEPNTLPETGSTNTENNKVEEQLKEDATSAREQIIGVFSACLPVLRARKANLSMAQELIDSAQENFSLALRMESMGID